MVIVTACGQTASPPNADKDTCYDASLAAGGSPSTPILQQLVTDATRAHDNLTDDVNRLLSDSAAGASTSQFYGDFAALQLDCARKGYGFKL